MLCESGDESATRTGTNRSKDAGAADRRPTRSAKTAHRVGAVIFLRYAQLNERRARADQITHEQYESSIIQSPLIKLITTTIALLVLLSVTSLLRAMATEQFGPDRPGQVTIPQSGWPCRIEQALRDPSRVYSVWVNGDESFYFDSTPEKINKLLNLYSKARLRDHEVKLEIGKPATVSLMDKRSFNYNLKISMIGGIALYTNREDDTNNGRTLEPSLTLYLDANRVLPTQLKLPENVVVTGNAELPGLNNRRMLPKRRAYYGRIQFDNGDTSNGIDQGVSTRIVYWEKDDTDGIEVAESNRDGIFRVILSDSEIAAIKHGDAWLTVSAGNFLAKMRKDARQFPATMLNDDKAKVQPLKISAPEYYYGRILFEDGTPAVLKHVPWAGAKISLAFPYVGPAELDEQGYFQICLEPDQFDELLKRGASKNVYIPDEEQGRSTAREEFPARLLSQDKAKAGKIEIPKPVYAPQR